MGVNFRSINKFTEIYCFRISQKKIVNVSEGYTNILFMGFSSPISKLINNNQIYHGYAAMFYILNLKVLNILMTLI